MSPRRPRILLADDHRMLTEALASSLRDQFEVVGRYSNGRELLAAPELATVDAVVVDITMPELNGIETARRISSKYPRLPVIFLTMHSDRPYVEEALRAGAMGYVLKLQSGSELATAIRSAIAGKRYISPSAWRPAEWSIATREDILTPRQREVLQLIAEGKSGKEIANALAVSVKTVEFHKAAIMERLGLRTTAELTRYAIEHHISG